MKIRAPTVFLPLLAVILAGILLLPRGGSPLPGEGRRNPLGKLYDRLAFTWHFTRANFRGQPGEEDKRLADLARAVLHRPSFSREAFGLAPGDYLGLARKFAGLGMAEDAGRFYAAHCRADPGRSRARTGILGCAALGDWENVSRLAAESTARDPDFSEGYYWWGRALLENNLPRDALEKLGEAGRIDPKSGDLGYWLGKAYAASGSEEEAAGAYRAAVSAAPAHRGAWKALAELHRESGEDDAARKARERVSSLTAEEEIGTRFGEGLILVGHDGLPPEARGEAYFPLTLYYEFLPGAQGTVTPYLRFRTGPFQKRIFLEPISPGEASPGETIIRPHRPILPWDIVPLRQEVLIGFLDEAGEPLRIFDRRENELKLGEAEIAPGLFPCPVPDPLAAEIPGEKPVDLGKRTVLAGENSVELKIPDSGTLSAIGIISYTEGTIALPQKKEVAAVHCLGSDGSVAIFSIRLGLETADRWLESRASHVPRHQTARIISSHPAGDERSYNWHYYLVLLPLPQPGAIDRLSLQYTGPSDSCWVARNIFLLPGNEAAGRDGRREPERSVLTRTEN